MRYKKDLIISFYSNRVLDVGGGVAEPGRKEAVITRRPFRDSNGETRLIGAREKRNQFWL